jgi:hypothetical protein
VAAVVVLVELVPFISEAPAIQHLTASRMLLAGAPMLRTLPQMVRRIQAMVAMATAATLAENPAVTAVLVSLF